MEKNIQIQNKGNIGINMWKQETWLKRKKWENQNKHRKNLQMKLNKNLKVIIKNSSGWPLKHYRIKHDKRIRSIKDENSNKLSTDAGDVL